MIEKDKLRSDIHFKTFSSKRVFMKISKKMLSIAALCAFFLPVPNSRRAKERDSKHLLDFKESGINSRFSKQHIE